MPYACAQRPKKRWSSLAFAVAITAAGPAASEGISLPYAPQVAAGEDSIQTANGTRCTQSLNAGSYLDVGVGATRQSKWGGVHESGDDTGVIGYARVIVPLGSTPERLDCRRLYDLEIARPKMEIETMKMGLK